MDELIIPRHSINYMDMMTSIDKIERSNTPIRSFIFVNDYFFLDLPPSGKQNVQHLTTQSQLQRIPPSDPGYACKSIVDLRSCVRMHNHYCWEHIKPHDHSNVFLGVEHGMNHHYKKCHLSKHKCRELLSQATSDRTMERYQKDLKSRVEKRVKELNIAVPKI